MKRKNIHPFILKISAGLSFFLLFAFSLVIMSFRAQEKLTDDMWKALGITQKAGDEKIQTSFINGYLYYYGVKNMKNIAVNNRGQIARDLLNYTKAYINGPVFRKQYEQMRRDAKPQEPVLKKLRTIEEIQKEEIAKTEKSLKETNKTIKEMPDMAKSLQPLVDMLQKNLKDYQDPKNSYFSSIALGEKYQQEDEVRSYKERFAKWEKNYPENMNLFVAERLKTMLDATRDIDYNAQLVEKNGKKKFVNKSYEYKSQEWKQGFRAGKEVTEASRAFAQKWMEELK